MAKIGFAFWPVLVYEYRVVPTANFVVGKIIKSLLEME
jgi:hypothetical protein